MPVPTEPTTTESELEKTLDTLKTRAAAVAFERSGHDLRVAMSVVKNLAQRHLELAARQGVRNHATEFARHVAQHLPGISQHDGDLTRERRVRNAQAKIEQSLFPSIVRRQRISRKLASPQLSSQARPMVPPPSTSTGPRGPRKHSASGSARRIAPPISILASASNHAGPSGTKKRVSIAPVTLRSLMAIACPVQTSTSPSPASQSSSASKPTLKRARESTDAGDVPPAWQPTLFRSEQEGSAIVWRRRLR
ncbi:hypothetical protein B0H15DRAFT_934743 [Mycena belliarum]|uniref:Uncharacterized protein n=1 Tax=Mycena belliarum TaxID=1033014 RepID=A0AAD6TQ66_9AGAR|nr:hypothetical protein B0H15DRAFT_934743 [Mycena belliae]